MNTRLPSSLNRGWVLATLAGAAGALAGAAMIGDVERPLLPHGVSFTWNPALVWLHVASDGLIGLAFIVIAGVIGFFLLRRRDLSFNWVFALFAAFIVASGLTHFLAVWNVWHAQYWVSGVLKAATAAIAATCAVALLRFLPVALALPDMRSMQAMLEGLEARLDAQRRVEAELRRTQATLENRVAERTAALDLANRQKDAFLARVSHELRTPQQALVGWASVLRRPDLPAASVAEIAERIERNTLIQSRLVGDLLDMTQIQNDRLRLDIAAGSPSLAIARGIETLQAAASEHGVRIAHRREPGTAELTLAHDAQRLQQVVWNILGNAIRLSAPGSTVEVAESFDANSYRVAVTDAGPGLTASQIAQLFTPFSRIEHRGRDAHRGLGLGLSIAASIVAGHGGWLRASSDGPGHGARFEFELPREAAVPAD